MAPSNASLRIQVLPRKVIVYLTITNPSATDPLFVEKSKVLLDPPLRMDLFRIAADGIPVPYIGALAKRAPPGPNDFLRIAPGGSIRSFADITRMYAFPPREHHYSIVYSAFHADPRDDTKLIRIDSDPATFNFSGLSS